jgi:hypothetical protein
MHLHSLASAVPARSFSQAECWEAMSGSPLLDGLRPSSASVLRKVLTGGTADELDALFLCTCTGYLCPGVTSHVAEQAGMRPDVYLADLVGLGCGAAIPMMRAAHGYLSANPGESGHRGCGNLLHRVLCR